MLIIPAIDIKNGKVVRLKQGQFDDVTEYSDDPLKVAQNWVSKGAQRIHLVDLDGALHGKMKNFEIIEKIAGSINIPVQIGGGIRTRTDISNLIGAGIEKVILSTKIIEDTDFLTEILKKWQEKIIISLDCSNGFLTQRGWTKTTDIKAVDFAKQLKEIGISCIIYTDISRDGMLSGPNWEEIKNILSIGIPVIASGGISNLADIQKLLDLKLQYPNLIGVITGKAIYEGKLDLKEAIRLCSQKG